MFSLLTDSSGRSTNKTPKSKLQDPASGVGSGEAQLAGKACRVGKERSS